MKRLAVILALIAAPVLAQTPTDAEIDQAHSVCNQGDHIVPIGSFGSRPPDAGHYKPEWKHCEAIDIEWQKRDLVRKAKDAAERDATSNLSNRLRK